MLAFSFAYVAASYAHPCFGDLNVPISTDGLKPTSIIGRPLLFTSEAALYARKPVVGLLPPDLSLYIRHHILLLHPFIVGVKCTHENPDKPSFGVNQITLL